jgi:hypothetical protein
VSENAGVYFKNRGKMYRHTGCQNKTGCLALNLVVCLLTTWLRRVKNDSHLNLKLTSSENIVPLNSGKLSIVVIK